MNGAIARILLRYLVGAALMKSPELGETLSTDPDIVMFAAAGVGVVTEGCYAFAKKRGWTL